MNSHLHSPRPSAQRGAAALIVVLLLFFIISLVAAYAGRNLIFEQKTSTNQYRSTQAFEAAEAGLEWALAMLNGGSVTDACVPPVPADPAQPSFRARYLTVDKTTGSVTPRTSWAGGITPERPSCVQSGAGWNCSCPMGELPTPAVPGGGGIHPAFRVCFERVPVDPLVPLGPVQPGAVRIVSTGGTRFGIVDRLCTQRGEGIGGEAAATVSVVVALASALPTPPSAGLTVRGNLNVTDTMRLLPNPVPTRQDIDTLWMPSGWLVQVGGPAPDLSEARPANVHGTPIAALVAVDPALGNLTAGQMFTSLFNMDQATYKKQPATVVLNDCAAACSAKLLAAWQSNPGRILWVEGDMTVESDVILGCPANPADPVVDPVLVVATGNINLDAASVRVCGVLYSQAPTWDNGGLGGVDVQGAAVAENNFTGSGIGGAGPWVQYRADILNRLSLGTGSFVRVPGSWRDFP